MKIAIIGGAGNVGSTLAYTLVEENVYDEVILQDLNYDRACGVSLDIAQSAYAIKSKTKVTAQQKIEDLVGIDIVIITAGFPRLPGMSRADLIEKNSNIIEDIFNKLKEPQIKAIVVTNPLDIMVYKALQTSKWSKNRIMGMGGILDSSRFAYYVSKETDVSISKIQATVVGAHSKSMIPLVSQCIVDGKRLEAIVSKQNIAQIVEDTKNGGAAIVSHLKNGSAFYAPARAVSSMVRAIATDSKEIFSCCVGLENEHEPKNISIGMLVKLGKNGVEEIVDMKLDNTQKELFSKSIEEVKKLCIDIN